MNYDTATRSIWRQSAGRFDDRPDKLKEMIRCATLAPSSHNTQCWRFGIAPDGVAILPDFTRRCPVVDPDDHHLFVSLGCAAENLVLAGRALGMAAHVAAAPTPRDGLQVTLVSADERKDVLSDAIPARQCTRAEYDGRPLSVRDLEQLETAGTAGGTHVLLLTGRAAIEKVLEYVLEGNTAQIRDPAFVQELRQWVRFSEAEAIEKGDGLFGRVMGNPTVPRWLGDLVFGLTLRPKSENDKQARWIRSSSGIAVFVSERDNPEGWMQAGRCYERFALQATALGIRNAFINQPVELAPLRQKFAQALGITSGRADLVVRFGRGREMPRSLRRPLDAVIEGDVPAGGMMQPSGMSPAVSVPVLH